MMLKDRVESILFEEGWHAANSTFIVSISKQKTCDRTFLMHRVIVFIEFTFTDGDFFVAYPACDSVKCQRGWAPERATSTQEPSL